MGLFDPALVGPGFDFLLRLGTPADEAPNFLSPEVINHRLTAREKIVGISLSRKETVGMYSLIYSRFHHAPVASRSAESVNL